MNEPTVPREPEGEPEPPAQEPLPAAQPGSKRRGLAGWVEKRAKKVVSHVYQEKADDIEDRARRAVTSAYRDHADDLEDRAVRALRRALHEESERIKEVIEHSVRVKKREVRLSLFVLILAALIYLALEWFSREGAG